MKGTTIKLNGTIKLVSAHDYITLSCPAGNFTVNRSGCSMTGYWVSQVKRNVMTAMHEFVKSHKNTGEGMRALATPQMLSTFFKDWNNDGEIPLKSGDRVSCGNQYGLGTVIERRTKNWVIQLDKGGKLVSPSYALVVMPKETPAPATKVTTSTAPKNGLVKRPAPAGTVTGAKDLAAMTYQDLAKMYQTKTGQSFIGKSKAQLVELLNKA